MKVPKIFNDRKSYLQQFERTASGEYVYVGNTFAYSDPEKSRKQTITEYWIPAAIMMVASFTQGLVPAKGMMNCPYVILPFGGSFLSAVSVIWALVKLSANKDPLREYIYTSTVQALPIRAMFATVLAFAAFLGEFVFVLVNGMPDPQWSLLLLALMLLDACMALLVYLRTKKEKWELCEIT